MQLYDLMPYWAVVGAVLDDCLQRVPPGGEEHRPAPGFPTVRSLLARLHLALTEAETILSVAGAGLAGGDGPTTAAAGPATAAASQATAAAGQATAAAGPPRGAGEARPAFAAAFQRIADGLRQPAPADPAARRAILRGLWSKLDKVVTARAHLILHLHSLGVGPPATWAPRRDTPADGWADGPVAAHDVLTRWPHFHRRYLRTLQALPPGALAYRPAPGRAGLGDLLLHIPIRERWLLCLATGRHPGPEPINGEWFRLKAAGTWSALGERFATVADLTELWGRVRRATSADLAGLTTGDLRRQVETPAGIASGHYLLWHALEHGIHHLAQADLMAAIAGAAR